MRRTILLGIVILGIVGAIFYLDASLRPAWLQRFFDQTPPPSAARLGLLEQKPVTAGAPAPDFALQDLNGRVLKLSDFRGEKVVLNFWATWCPPCREEMPDFDAVYREHRDENLVFLGVNMQEPLEAVRQFLQEEVQVSYPIVLDTDGSVTRGYNVRTYPTTYFIDEQGRFAQIGSFVGKFGAFTREELRQRIEEFLGPTSAAAASSRSAGEVEIKTGHLGSKYFSAGELNRIGLQIDTAQIPYRADLDLQLLAMGCPFVDCIPSIDQPSFESPQQASSWLKDDDLIMGVVLEEIVKAYPLKILTWHEIVNDRFGQLAVTITFCPLCNSGLVFERPIIDGELAEFGVSGRLYKSDLVMYDRVTGTLWSQLEGAPIIGPLVGKINSLQRLPVEVVPWKNWKALHPDTLVLARPTQATPMGGRPAFDLDSTQPVRDYERNPYEYQLEATVSYFAGSLLKDKRLDSFATIIGLVVNGSAKAYLPEAVQKVGLLNDQLGGEPVLVLWDDISQSVKFFRRRVPQHLEPLEFALEDDQLIDRKTRSIWDFKGHSTEGPLHGLSLEPLIGVRSFWFAWLAFNPSTEIFFSPQ